MYEEIGRCMKRRTIYEEIGRQRDGKMYEEIGRCKKRQEDV